jgi:ferrous iron transport protein B
MECCSPKEKSTDPSYEKVILIGNPNVGKSVIFNYLTGKYVTVSNYPGTTVEIATGTMEVHGKDFRSSIPQVSTPSFPCQKMKGSPGHLLDERQEHLVQVIDAKNLRRGLLISSPTH